MCIFPSDGTNRIRFTGQDHRVQSQPDASGSPKTYVLCGYCYYSSHREKVKKKQRRCLCLSLSKKSFGLFRQTFCSLLRA